MKYLNTGIGALMMLVLVLTGILVWPGQTCQAGTRDRPCADEQQLTAKARIALVAAQKAMAEDKGDLARTTLKTFVRTYPEQGHVFIAFTLAGLALDAGESAAALDWYEKTLALCPDYAPAWQNLGKVSYDLGRFDRAAQAFEQCWELTGKTNAMLRFHAAAAHLSAKAPARALAHLAFLCSGQAGTPTSDWVRLYAQVSVEQKQTAKALAVVERLLTGPDPESYLFRLAATLYLDLTQYDQAAQTLEAYALLEPLTYRERILLADLNNTLGIFARAAAHYELALAEKSAQPIYERMASAWFEACEPEKALAAADKGLDSFPQSSKLWKLKGWIFYEQNAFDEAFQAFGHCVALDSNDIKSVFMQGLCAHKAGHGAKARAALTRAAAHPDYKTRALGLLRQMDAAPAPEKSGSDSLG